MLKRILSALPWRSYLPHPRGSAIPSKLSSPKRSSPGLRHRPWSGSHDGQLKRLSLGNRTQSSTTSEQPSRSDETVQERPDWPDQGPGSEHPVQGAVTAIDVPGSGTFTLYGPMLSLIFAIC